MHILLVILKILLIIVLSLVGLAVAIALLILFVPVRYKLYASKYDSIFAKFTARWMGFVLCFKAVYDTDGLEYRLRLFGGTIIGNKQKIPEREDSDEDTAVRHDIDDIENASVEQEDDDEQDKYPSVAHEDRDFVLEDREFDEKPSGFFDRIGGMIDRACGSILDKVKSITDRIIGLKKKKDGYTKLINNVRTKEAIRIVKAQLLKLLRHLKPAKLRGQVTYGAGDPAETGQHLGYMSVFFPLYCDNIDITPDFSKKIFEGDIFIKGRIRIAVICLYVLKVVLNKNVKITVERFKKISKGV